MSQPRLIEMRFVLNRERQIPDALRQETSETAQEKIDRLSRNESTGISGQMAVESTDKIFLFDFIQDLPTNKYIMVDAYWRYQIMSDRQQKPIVRFTFVHYDHLEEPFLNNKLLTEFKDAKEALYQFCLLSMWRGQVWDNPYFENQEVLPGQSALSVNLIGRQPLYDESGNPHSTWTRNDEGEVIRDEDGNPKEKVYTVPDSSLRLNGGKVFLEKVDHEEYINRVTTHVMPISFPVSSTHFNN